MRLIGILDKHVLDSAEVHMNAAAPVSPHPPDLGQLVCDGVHIIG